MKGFTLKSFKNKTNQNAINEHYIRYYHKIVTVKSLKAKKV